MRLLKTAKMLSKSRGYISLYVYFYLKEDGLKQR